MPLEYIGFLLRLFLIVISAFFIGSFIQLLKHNNSAKYLLLLLVVFIFNYSLNFRPFYELIIIKKIYFITTSASVLIYFPLLYLYIKNIEAPKRFTSFTNYIHFVPALLYLLFLLPIFNLKINNPELFDNEIERIYNREVRYYDIIFDIFFTCMASVQVITYLSLIYLTKRRYHQKLKQNYSEVDSKMLKWIDYLIVFIVVLSLVFYIISYGYHLSNYAFSIISDLIFLCIIVYVGIHGLKQKEPYSSGLHQANDKSAGVNTSYKTEKLSIEQKIDLKNMLKELMETERLYLNHEIQLIEIANKLNTSKNKISQVLNEDLGINFYNYINSMRIEAACQMLNNKEYDILTLEGISEKAGFKSKTSFNQSFKSMKGKTPSEYRKERL